MNNNKTSELTEKFLAKLHQGSKPSTQEYARELRHRTTEAEQKLWSFLRNRQLKGEKSEDNSQLLIMLLIFIVTNVNSQSNWMEIFILKQKKDYDNSRTALLNEIGITVLRFWNDEIINDSKKVLQKISDHLI